MPISSATDHGIDSAETGFETIGAVVRAFLLPLGWIAVSLIFSGCGTDVALRGGNEKNNKVISQTRLTQSSRSSGDIVAYYESGAYLHDIGEVVIRAKAWIDWRAGQPRRAGERLMLVLDVDDTVLSSFPGIREGCFQSGSGDAEENAEEAVARAAWCQKAAAPAIAPLLDLFQFTLARKVEVVFVSERIEPDLRDATEDNLRAAGFAGYTKLIMRPKQYAAVDLGLWKADVRRELVFEGGTIIAAIGDQPSDLSGQFIERTFRLPALSR